MPLQMHLLRKNEEQKLPPSTAQKTPELPKFATHDSASSDFDISGAFKEPKDATSSLRL